MMEKEEPKLWEYFCAKLCCRSTVNNNRKTERQSTDLEEDNWKNSPEKIGKSKKSKSKNVPRRSDLHDLIDDDSYSRKQSNTSERSSVKANTVETTLIDILEYNKENESSNEASTLPLPNNHSTFKQKISERDIFAKQFIEIEENLKQICNEIDVSLYTNLFEKKSLYQKSLVELKNKVSDFPDRDEFEENKILLLTAIDTCWQKLHYRLSAEKQSKESVQSIDRIKEIAAESERIWSEIENDNIKPSERTYHDEMLMKLLLDLDNLDVVNQPDVRDIRRDVIRNIQDKMETLNRT